MANIIVSVSEPTVNVDSTNNTVNVSTTTSNISVSNISVVSNSQIRQGISISNVSGFGNLAYDSTASSNGIIQYTGTSQADVRGSISNASPILYNSTTGVISANVDAIFSNTLANNWFTSQTTDQLTEGASNLYFTQTRARQSISASGNISYNNSSGVISEDLKTQDVTEGDNLYFTSARSRGNISVTDSGGDGSLAYDSGTGVITYTGPSASEVRAHISATANIFYNSTTGVISEDLKTQDITEGDNLYFTAARSRGNISVTQASPSGTGALAYNSGTGVITYTPPDSLSNADVQTFIEANGLDASANLTTTANTSAAHGTFTGATSLTATGNVSVGGNLNVTGNINSETVVDLFVEDRNITLQYGSVGSPSANSQIFVDRGSSANTYILWDEGSDSWKFSNDGSTDYAIPVSTSDLAEGTNLYFTPARARGNISVTDSGGDGSLAYDSGTGVITYTGPSAAETRAHISVTDAGGLGSASYDSGTGVITYTGPADSDVRGLVSTTTTSASGGGSLAYDSGTGVFTFAPADLSDKIDLTDLSVTTGTSTSGNSSLAYDNTTGTFTFKPVDIEVLTGVDYGSTPTGNPNGAINYKTRSISNVSAIQGSNTGSFLELAGNISSMAAGGPHYIHYDYVRSKQSMLTNRIAFDAGTAGTDDGIINLANGVLSSSVFTALQSDNALANIDNFGNINATYFHGDGSNITNVTSDVTSENIVRVCIAAETLAKGDAVYISGGTGDNPEVSKADADDAAKMPVFGIAKEAISSTNTGNVVIYGEITSFNTTSFSTGDSLFVSTTAGALQNTAPTGESSLIQKIGKVVKGGSAGGKITVTGAGRTNATPNLNEGNIFLGDTNNQTRSVTPDGNFTTTANAFSLSTTLTDVNSIASVTGSNISLDTNTKAVKILKDFASVTSQDTLILDSDGYRPLNWKTAYPSYSGSGLRRNTLHQGTATAGSPVVTVTESAVNFWYGTPTAGQRTDAFANIAANCMFVTKATNAGTGNSTTSPFPIGTRILSVDATAFTITMTQNATADATFSQANGTGLFTGDGAYDTNQPYGELYVTNADWNGGSDQSIEFAVFTGSTDDLSYGVDGPQDADLTTSVASGTITNGDYYTSQRSKVTTNLGYTASKNGFTVGDGATLSSRFENDNFATKGINILHDGEATFSTEFGSSSWNSQYGIKQYTESTLQNSFPTQGPRLLLSSAKGKISDDPFNTYPRSGQSLGQIAWQATTGKSLTPSSLRVPVYINAIASEDHSLGSNTNVYFGVTSNSDNQSVSNKAHIYLASQDGKTIIAAGEKGTTKEDIYFAPALQPNPGYSIPTTYDFSTVAGQKSWAKMNYANTSATSGAQLTVTHGQSAGAGTVGDQVVKLARNDNSYSLTGQVINADNTPNNVFGAGVVGNSFDAIGSLTSSGNYVDGTAAVISGFTGSPYAALNGTTKYLKFFGQFGSIAVYELYDDAGLTTGFASGIAAGSAQNLGPGVFTYTATQSSGVTAKSYSLELEEQSNVLKIKEDAAVRLSIDTTETELFNRLQLYSLTTTEINALASPQAGQVVYNSTLNQMCLYNGSAWQKITQATM